MKLQELLRMGYGEQHLAEKYSITAKHHPRFFNLVQFTYDQIDSPMGEQVVQEARGVILDQGDNWSVIARPFDKFFNYGEGHAKPLDWSTAKVQEKVDGSLMILYHYAGEWHVATRGMPDAGGQVNATNVTFSELFWSTWRRMHLELPPKVWRDCTFMFELTSPLNRVVVQHWATKLTLIGVRERSGKEWPVENFANLTAFSPNGEIKFPWFPTVHQFPLQTMEQIEATFATMSPTSQEGYVVVDGNFNRVKVKSPAYVALHHLKDGFGVRRLMEIVQSNETSEFLAYFPEWKAPYEELRSRYDALAAELEAAYESLKEIPIQKDFALKAVKTRFSAPLFMLRKGQSSSIRQALAGVHADTMIDLLKANEIPMNTEVAV